MLIQFSVENFKSFRDKAVLNLLATSDESHPELVVSNNTEIPRRILRTAAIYGPNASGKSNLINAMHFARQQIVSDSKSERSMGSISFKLTSKTNIPSRFQFVFSHGGAEYTYGFALNRSRVIEEYLYRGAEEVMFERDADQQFQFDTPLTENDATVKNILEVKKADVLHNQLFLNSIFNGNLRRQIPALQPVINWFNQVLTIIPAEPRLRSLEWRFHTKKAMLDFMGLFLNASGTGIDQVQTTETPLDWSRDLPWVPEEVRVDIETKSASEDQDTNKTDQETKSDVTNIVEISGILNNQALIRRGQNGDLYLIKLYFQHQMSDGAPTNFELHEESDGTQRLVHLAPMLFDIVNQEQRIFIVDELDRRFHTALSFFLLQTFAQHHGNNQLIFTTHDTNLLDLNRLRRDQIWFVEKQQDGNSSLYSLAEFKIQPELQIEKGYLNGRFGAIPFITDIESLGWTASTDTADTRR